ncbi:hypothetical protein [Mucilaginibacter gotjawali]|uniref:Uncharacterized protein n=1 Tax=Mucilaginibacter gotjawali TaxID=1550579 RepID=A0A839SCT1_9SPHI|nr:hypothetical protein [Mucilaginibacter gotjawali]MBB3054710.1 hypothetical protein [Mucilaginibacter gotjawali]
MRYLQVLTLISHITLNGYKRAAGYTGMVPEKNWQQFAFQQKMEFVYINGFSGLLNRQPFFYL